jgi:hypothetical protein
LTTSNQEEVAAEDYQNNIKNDNQANPKSSTFEQQTGPEDNLNTNRKPTPTFSKNYIQQTRVKETTLHQH